MINEIAQIIGLRLISLPFLDVVAGMTAVVTNNKYAEETNSPLTAKLPVSNHILKYPDGGTAVKEKSLVPNAGHKGILYFEENGAITLATDSGAAIYSYVGSIRAIVWLNKKKMVEGRHVDFTMPCVNDILKLIKLGKGINLFGISGFFINSVKVIQTPDIFSKYNYNDEQAKFLRPPYEFFALDLGFTFRAGKNCTQSITFNNDNN